MLVLFNFYFYRLFFFFFLKKFFYVLFFFYRGFFFFFWFSSILIPKSNFFFKNKYIFFLEDIVYDSWYLCYFFNLYPVWYPIFTKYGNISSRLRVVPRFSFNFLFKGLFRLIKAKRSIRRTFFRSLFSLIRNNIFHYYFRCSVFYRWRVFFCVYFYFYLSWLIFFRRLIFFWEKIYFFLFLNFRQFRVFSDMGSNYLWLPSSFRFLDLSCYRGFYSKSYRFGRRLVPLRSYLFSVIREHIWRILPATSRNWYRPRFTIAGIPFFRRMVRGWGVGGVSDYRVFCRAIPDCSFGRWFMYNSERLKYFLITRKFSGHLEFFYLTLFSAYFLNFYNYFNYYWYFIRMARFYIYLEPHFFFFYFNRGPYRYWTYRLPRDTGVFSRFGRSLRLYSYYFFFPFFYDLFLLFTNLGFFSKTRYVTSDFFFCIVKESRFIFYIFIFNLFVIFYFFDFFVSCLCFLKKILFYFFILKKILEIFFNDFFFFFNFGYFFYFFKNYFLFSFLNLLVIYFAFTAPHHPYVEKHLLEQEFRSDKEESDSETFYRLYISDYETPTPTEESEESDSDDFTAEAETDGGNIYADEEDLVDGVDFLYFDEVSFFIRDFFFTEDVYAETTIGFFHFKVFNIFIISVLYRALKAWRGIRELPFWCVGSILPFSDFLDYFFLVKKSEPVFIRYRFFLRDFWFQFRNEFCETRVPTKPHHIIYLKYPLLLRYNFTRLSFISIARMNYLSLCKILARRPPVYPYKFTTTSPSPAFRTIFGFFVLYSNFWFFLLIFNFFTSNFHRIGRFIVFYFYKNNFIKIRKPRAYIHDRRRKYVPAFFRKKKTPKYWIPGVDDRTYTPLEWARLTPFRREGIKARRAAARIQREEEKITPLRYCNFWYLNELGTDVELRLAPRPKNKWFFIRHRQFVKNYFGYGFFIFNSLLFPYFIKFMLGVFDCFLRVECVCDGCYNQGFNYFCRSFIRSFNAFFFFKFCFPEWHINFWFKIYGLGFRAKTTACTVDYKESFRLFRFNVDIIEQYIEYLKGLEEDVFRIISRLVFLIYHRLTKLYRVQRSFWFRFFFYSFLLSTPILGCSDFSIYFFHFYYYCIFKITFFYFFGFFCASFHFLLYEYRMYDAWFYIVTEKERAQFKEEFAHLFFFNDIFIVFYSRFSYFLLFNFF